VFHSHKFLVLIKARWEEMGVDNYKNCFPIHPLQHQRVQLQVLLTLLHQDVEHNQLSLVKRGLLLDVTEYSFFELPEGNARVEMALAEL